MMPTDQKRRPTCDYDCTYAKGCSRCTARVPLPHGEVVAEFGPYDLAEQVTITLHDGDEGFAFAIEDAEQIIAGIRRAALLMLRRGAVAIPLALRDREIEAAHRVARAVRGIEESVARHPLSPGGEDTEEGVADFGRAMNERDLALRDLADLLEPQQPAEQARDPETGLPSHPPPAHDDDLMPF